MVNNPQTPANTLPFHAHFRRINWRQEYLHIAALFMTACFVAPWMSLTVNYFIDISLVSCLGLTAAHLTTSMILVRILIHRRVTGSLILMSISLLMWVAAGITILLTPSLARAYGNRDDLALIDLFTIDKHARVPGGPVLIVWVVYLWWRGYHLGNVYTTLVRASFIMRLGILSFLWVVISVIKRYVKVCCL
jgi:hypothetical protein